jgi:hypothetical protein
MRVIEIKGERMNIFKFIAEAAREGINIEKATCIQDASRVAIHLFEPDSIQLEHAIAEATAHNQKLILVHTTATWPYQDVSWAKKAVIGGVK